MQRLLFIIALFLLAASSRIYAVPPTQQQIDESRLAALAWLVGQQKGDGSWRDVDGGEVRNTSAVASALINAGINKGFLLNSALIYLRNSNPASIDSLARQLYTLNQAGVDVTDLKSRLIQSQNGSGTWRAYSGYGSSLPDTPLALLALFQTNNFNYHYSVSYGPLCDGFLYSKRADNSFSYLVNGTDFPLSQGEGSIISTAYAARLVSKLPAETGTSSFTCYRLEGGSYVPTVFNFNTIKNNAIAWLISQQSLSDGGFGRGTISNSLETAIAYAAIKEVAPSTYAVELDEALGYLVTHQNTDGSWEGDLFTTALALQTLPTLISGTLADADGNGVPDQVEVLLGEDPLIADRNGASGNGQSLSGITHTEMLSSANQYSNYSYMLPGGSGNPPYTWSLITGSLPNGMSLNATTGEISGWSGTTGTFNFTYRVIGTGNSEQFSAQISVLAAPEVVQVPVPPWAILTMAIGLFMVQRLVGLKTSAD